MHASNNDEAGTVKLHLVIHTDGTIWMANVVKGSGSPSLDAATIIAFREGFVRPFPAGIPEAVLDVSAHYVLAYRRDQPPTAGITVLLQTAGRVMLGGVGSLVQAATRNTPATKAA